jgi:DNA-binding MarR family transcriptional regulator
MGFRMSHVSPEELRELGTAHLGRLLLQALRRVQATSVGKLQQRGHPAVRTGHIPVFGQVAAGPARITDLAASAGMTRQMMGRLVRELEDEGYVRSGPDLHDQRAVMVELTPRGVAFCDDAQQVMTEMEAEYAELLGGDGLDQLRTALARLAT